LPSAARYLAIDIGASGGRSYVGAFDGERLALAPNHGFANRPVQLRDGLRWDALGLFAGVLDSVGAAQGGGALDSLGVDTWAVDFGLLDEAGALIGNPRHHRDPRNLPMVDQLLETVGAAEAYAVTGIQFMPINTVCQLLALRGTPELEAARTLLLMPDLLTHWLGGDLAAEATNASTTQMLDARSHDWAAGFLSELRLPAGILPAVVAPGTRAGSLSPEVAAGAGIEAGVPLVRVASHDTASAVVGVPAGGGDFAYVSSGTWSLVGMELEEPVLGAEALAANLTNELGFEGRDRLLKNVMGLWLLQQSEAELGAGYEELVAEAAGAADAALFDPDESALLAPGPMVERIAEAIRRGGGEPPHSRGGFARSILESLACKYRHVLELVEGAAGRAAGAIHIVGGGSRNLLLCQLTADVCARPVIAGPVEATAIGNVMVQAHAAGRIGSLAEIREVVRASVELRVHQPAASDGGLYERFGAVLAAAPPAASVERSLAREAVR
jgi:rhamnulokinase